MGWLDRFFRKQPEGTKLAQTLSGYLPVYSQFGTNIYASDVVQQALKCIVDELKKLQPKHIRLVNNDPVPIRGNIQDVLNDPNPLMTTTEFLEKMFWMLLLNYNAFVIPTYYVWKDNHGVEKRKFEYLYPIKPSEVDFIEDALGRLFVKFTFWNGSTTTLPYENVIHIKLNYSVNDYMGGDDSGQPNNRPVLDTLRLNDQLLKGVAKAMNASYAVNGVVKYNTIMDGGKTEKALAEMEKKLQNSENGFLPLDLKAEFTPLPRETKIVDTDTLRFIDEKLLRNWGVPLHILKGDFTKPQYNAFYQKTLEPIIIATSQAFTKKLLTREERARGNRIDQYPKDLIFMTVEQTLEMVTLLSNTGALYENEKRAAFGLPPLPELEGKRFMSLNWVEADKAAAYQLGRINAGSGFLNPDKPAKEGGS